MLCFLWAMILYDGYLGPAGEAPIDTQQFALQSVDRQLRLCDGFETRPAPLRWLAGASTHQDALDRAVLQLDDVRNLNTTIQIDGRISSRSLMDEHGSTVYSILLTAAGKNDLARQNLPAPQSLEGRILDATLTDRMPTDADLAGLSHLLETDDACWWHLALARSHQTHPGIPAAIERQEKRSEHLANLALLGRGAVWLLVLIGALAAPRGLRLLARGLTRKSTGYPKSWPLNLALGVFLVCELGCSEIPRLIAFLPGASHFSSFFAQITIGSAARLGFAALACAFLFHRPRHAWRCFGGGEPVPWRALLGVFTLMFVAQEGLHLLLAPWIPIDPTGGVDSTQAGVTGLAALLVSACLVAPIGEELLYRGVLFQGLSNRLGNLAAAILSALMFTIVHFYGLYGTISVGILGVALALIYQSTRSLKAVIAFHAIYNLTVTLPDWIVHHSEF